MAYTFSVNNTPATGSVAMYQLISTLISAGWVKKADSDGTTYSATGVQVTSGNTGTNGLGNTKAWVRLQSPATNGGTIVNQTREFTIQRGTTDDTWRIKYSASALFAGGSPAATVTPSSTDEVFMTGGGTDASPTFYSYFPTTNQSYHWHIIAGGSTENYSFLGFTIIAGNTSSTLFGLDVMMNNTYPATDVDPAVAYCYVDSSVPFNSINVTGLPTTTNVTNPAYARAWMGATSAAGASTTSNNVNVEIVVAHTFGGGGAYLGSNPWTNKDDLISVPWASNITPKGIKGYSTLILQGSLPKGTMNTCDTVSTGSKDKISIGNFWVPWNGSDPLV